jgi:adenylosuccinate synthase
MKGTGSAVARKIMRNADQRMPPAVAKYEERLAPFIITDTEYRGMVYDSKLVLAEGSQGFSLGINSGFYPYTTSRECTPMQIMSDMLLSPRHLRWNVGSMRTFPIRVANRFDSDGQMIGTSGPCYPDQRETSWEEIGVEPELTTVTKLVRRVFTFSEMQFEHALQVCKPSHVFLNFANYMPKEVQRLRTRLTGLISKHGCFIYRHSGIRWEGWGPSFMDVREINADYESDED